MALIPKKENEGIGFCYHLELEQMREHQKKSTDEILNWIEEHAAILQAFRSEEDRERMRMLKNKKTSID